jgi:hypothetical protein
MSCGGEMKPFSAYVECGPEAWVYLDDLPRFVGLQQIEVSS